MATTGYILIEHFAVAVERRRRPELAGRPIVIGGYPHERKAVYDASAEAEAAGVKPGLVLRQAEHLCPTAVFIPLAKARYEEAAAEFLAAVESFSPAVLPLSLGSAYFDAHGLARLCGPDHELARRLSNAVQSHLGILPCVGLGPCRFAARVAAQSSRPGTPVVVDGDAAAFLHDLPVDFLIGDLGSSLGDEFDESYRQGNAIRDFCDRLRLLGIRTIGQFMRLPFAELMEQFGPLGVEAYRLARGRDDPPILPRPQPSALQRRQSFEPPLTCGPSLTGAIDRLSNTLASSLQQRYQACRTVILRLELDGASLEEIAQLKEPTAQSAKICAAAIRLSERMRIDNGREVELGPEIITVQIVVGGLVTQGGTQLGLFDAQRQRRGRLEQAIDEVQRRFGRRLKRAEPAPAIASAAAPAFVLRDY